MEAAHNLRSKVCEYVSNELDLPNNIKIKVRIYANMKGLASTYYHSKILDNIADLDAFVRGFNIGHPMSDFVDAGDGKECADSKLKGKLTSYGPCGSIIGERRFSNTHLSMVRLRYSRCAVQGGYLWRVCR